MWGRPEVRALMTLPSALRDLLIIFASSMRVPDAAVFFTFSEPARSTKNSLLFFTPPPPPLKSRWQIVMITTE